MYGNLTEGLWQQKRPHAILLFMLICYTWWIRFLQKWNANGKINEDESRGSVLNTTVLPILKSFTKSGLAFARMHVLQFVIIGKFCKKISGFKIHILQNYSLVTPTLQMGCQMHNNNISQPKISVMRTGKRWNVVVYVIQFINALILFLFLDIVLGDLSSVPFIIPKVIDTDGLVYGSWLKKMVGDCIEFF